MLFEMILAAGCGWCLAKNVEIKPEKIVDAVIKARSATVGFVDKVRLHAASKARRDQDIIMRQAQMMYELKVGEIFANASDGEKQTILDLFAKYGQQ